MVPVLMCYTGGMKCEPGCTCKRHQRKPASEEAKARMRAAQKCPPGCTCKRHRRAPASEETRARMREAQKDAKGKKCPPGCTCARHKGYYHGGSKKGRKFSEEARQHMAKGAQARTYTPEGKKSLSDHAKASHTDPEREAKRIAALKAAGTACNDGCNCERHSDRIRQLKAQQHLGTTHSEESKAKLSATLRQLIRDGIWEPSRTMPALYSRGGVSIWMRSPWEVEFAEEMDRHGIVWEYEPERFDLGWTTYRPDFFVPGVGLYVEVKGWLRNDASLKMESFKALGHDLVLFTYHPSARGMVNPLPVGVRTVYGPQIAEFMVELGGKV